MLRSFVLTTCITMYYSGIQFLSESIVPDFYVASVIWMYVCVFSQCYYCWCYCGIRNNFILRTQLIRLSCGNNEVIVANQKCLNIQLWQLYVVKQGAEDRCIDNLMIQLKILIVKVFYGFNTKLIHFQFKNTIQRCTKQHLFKSCEIN